MAEAGFSKERAGAAADGVPSSAALLFNPGHEVLADEV
jgi:hypothetical protein